MLDNLKLSTEDQNIINRLQEVQEFISYKPEDKYFKNENKYYRDFFHSFKHKAYGTKFRLHFQKVITDKVLVGYRSLHIVISPHYHFNNYLHNGNDFTPKDCINTLPEILTYLGIEPHEYDLLKVINIEFGINLIPEIDIKDLIDNILYFKKTPFGVPNPKMPYFRISNSTKYKRIKAYAKGLQFAEFLQYGINLNTFRFEVKSKKSTNIKKYKINTLLDLLKTETYQRLGQEIVNEWEQILLINQTSDFSNLKNNEVEFITKANNTSFWSGLKIGFHKDKFTREKSKYYKILKGKNNLHTQIKSQIIDKLISF